jgi:tetratricopeptide (TPR) repeat protein
MKPETLLIIVVLTLAAGNSCALTEAEKWVNRGNACDDGGEYSEAIECCEKALEQDPTLKMAWKNKGDALGYSGKDREAIECLDVALELDPEYKDAWRIKGGILYYLGNYAEAIECYDKVLELAPGNSKVWKVWYDKGRLHSLLGEKGKALSSLKTAIDLYGPRLKKNAKREGDFEAYWNDPDFLELVDGE